MSKPKIIKDLILKTEKIDWQSVKDLQPLSLKNDYNSGKLRESIINNGFTRAIYVWDSGKDIFCVDGHLRMDILKELVADDIKIPNKLNCTFLDLKSRKHAVKVLLEVFNTKTNRINKGSLEDWCEFEELSFDDDLDITFDDLHLDFESEEEEEVETEGDDETPETPEEPKTVLGDLYELGNHRVLCGDSTVITDVDKLMDGKKSDMVFTDPPYNVCYEYNSYNDNKTKEEYREFCKKWFALLLDVSKSIIITPGKQNLGLWYSISDIKDIGVWIKKNAMSGGRISHLNLFEPIVFIGSFDRSSRTNDIFEYNNKQQKDVAKEHTCPKSAELMAEIVECYSKKNTIILDVFLGSGSTLIAAEKTNRKCYGMELDPKYCDVIVKRYIDFCKKNDKAYTVKRNGVKCDDFK